MGFRVIVTSIASFVFMCIGVGCLIGFGVNVKLNQSLTPATCTIDGTNVTTTACRTSLTCKTSANNTCTVPCYAGVVILDWPCPKGGGDCIGSIQLIDPVAGVNKSTVATAITTKYPKHAIMDCVVADDGSPSKNPKNQVLLGFHATKPLLTSGIVFMVLFGLASALAGHFKTAELRRRQKHAAPPQPSGPPPLNPLQTQAAPPVYVAQPMMTAQPMMQQPGVIMQQPGGMMVMQQQPMMMMGGQPAMVVGQPMMIQQPMMQPMMTVQQGYPTQSFSPQSQMQYQR
ncbi:Uncharacterized protein PBTT_01626 [Plasmodiophora brassicae]